MQRKPEDIRLPARYGHVIFIDGYTARIAGQKFGKDQQGKYTYDLLLDPTEELIKRYDLKPNPNPAYGMAFEFQIPHEFLVKLSDDPVWTRWLCLRTYSGGSTPACELLLGNTQQETIVRLKDVIEKLKMQYALIKEERDLLKNNLPAYLKKNTAPLIDILLPLVEKATGRKGD